MAINLTDAKKKHHLYNCIAAANVAKYVADEYTCALGLQASYSHKPDRVFDNEEWHLNHSIAVEKSIDYLKTNFPGILIFDNESVKIKQRIGKATLFGIPDIIGLYDNKLYVVDGKSGRAKGYHRYQVSLYALMLLKQNVASEIGEVFLGYYDPKLKLNNFNMVSLGGHNEIQDIWSVDAKKKIVDLANAIVSDQELEARPTATNCQWCGWKNRCSVPYKESEELLDVFAGF